MRGGGGGGGVNGGEGSLSLHWMPHSLCVPALGEIKTWLCGSLEREIREGGVVGPNSRRGGKEGAKSKCPSEIQNWTQRMRHE